MTGHGVHLSQPRTHDAADRKASEGYSEAFGVITFPGHKNPFLGVLIALETRAWTVPGEASPDGGWPMGGCLHLFAVCFLTRFPMPAVCQWSPVEKAGEVYLLPSRCHVSGGSLINSAEGGAGGQLLQAGVRGGESSHGSAL